MNEKMIKNTLFLMAIICFFTVNILSAQEKIDENALFSNSETVVESADIVNNKEILLQGEEKKSVGISGELTNVASYTGTRDWLNNGDKKNNVLSTYILGNLLFDARLKKGTKGFSNIESQYDAQTGKTDFTLKELFLDFNIKNSIYFRTGKQVLQWGRCYLWNPVDLINVEKKIFLQKIGYRDGAYGIKLHIPFGTKFNIYGFFDTGSVLNIDEVGAAGKIEFLLGGTEMAVSAWGKKGFTPVFGYDFSSRISGVDIYGEASASYGDNYDKVKLENGFLIKERRQNEWFPKASFGFGRAIDFADVNDRINITGELYYNSAGYSENIFNDITIYQYMMQSNNGSWAAVNTTKKEFLLMQNLYEANNFSRYYAALFTSFSKFMISDMIFKLNLISNIEQKSFTLTTGVNYEDMNDFSFGFNIYSYLGDLNSEYTFSGNALTLLFTVGMVF
ncbi:MAG: hypothetical protein AABY84_04235 [Candidatus Firestonebacteria bacterium]